VRPNSQVALLGLGGKLHRAWIAVLRRNKIDYLPLGRHALDLTKPKSIDASLGNCRMVINCAAYTDVDQAEAEEELANQVNGIGVGHLARVCKERDALLVHYSSDYVFNGRASRPYPPSDPVDPINAYGRSKALGEKLIQESGCRHLIIRASWLYAPWGNNFVRTILDFVRKDQPLCIVNDQTGRPTSAEHLAENSMRLINKDARGIYHLADGGQCTWYEFAKEIASHVKANASVEICTTAELARPAARPIYSVLDLGQSEKLIGPMTPWKDALTDVIKRIE